jgi:hypothetical protein
MPDIDQMAWPAFRGDQDNVNADIVSWPNIARGKGIGRCCDAAEAVLVNRKVKFCLGCAGLYFNKSGHPSPPGDQIHFSRADLYPFANDAPSVQTKPPSGAAFAPMPAFFSLMSAHLPCIAIARV